MRIRRRSITLIGIAVLLGVAFYAGCVQRVRTRFEDDGWVLDFSYVRLRCPI